QSLPLPGRGKLSELPRLPEIRPSFCELPGDRLPAQDREALRGARCHM
ncbi:hypothetical protein AK812_SmicGene46315, partial [Symbiodinium microadriaticum]